MKKFFLILLCFAVYKGYAQQVVAYEFAFPQQVECGAGFSKLVVENCSYINEEGMPDIPVFGVNMLLEAGHEIASIAIKNIAYYPAIEHINICPAAANFPMSKGAPVGYHVVPNAEVYNADKNYPDRIVGGENTSFLRGHAIGSFLIYPVLYNPVQQRVEVIKSITLEIHTQVTPRAEASLKFLRDDHLTAQKLQQVEKNELVLNSYRRLSRQNNNPNYDILVITKQSFTSALNNYIAHKNKWGYKVLVKTVEEISSAYTGIDAAEKMRKCVIDAYTNDGISYLMLFGDSHLNGGSQHNIIPFRKMYGSSGSYTDNLPSDMYFACLDGTWYNSGDNSWGKPGFDDLGHEISVGRICADNTDEIERFVTKLVRYQETPVVEDVKKALMLGEQMDDAPTWGGDCKDQIAVGGTYNGYTTTGISSNFTISKLYDKNGSWSTTQLRSYFNNGIHLINHLGHANVTYNMKLSNWEITNANFTNNGIQRSLAIVYSQGCLNGAFDNVDDWGNDVGEDCINEMFHKLDGGIVANIGNSRYGWYNPNGTNGPSQRFDRYFFDGIFGQNIHNIGDANSYSKDVNQSLIQYNSTLRWCCYELNLMGDPSMDIWTDTPTYFDPQYVKAVKNTDTEILIFTGVPYARVAVFQNNVLLSRGVCDEDGGAVLIFNAPFNSSTAIISISAHNKYRYQQQGITYVVAPPVRDLKANVNEIKVALEWQAPDLSGNIDPPTAYIVYRDGEKIATLTTDNLSYQDNAKLIPNTTYEYCVKARYAGISSGNVCLTVKTGVFCHVVENIQKSVTGKIVTIYWSAPEVTPTKYTILRDGVLLKEITQTIFTDTVPKENTEYEYCIIAHYDGCDSAPACVKIKSGVLCGAIDDITATVDKLSIEISWNHLSPNQLVQYVITRDGVVVKETTETSFTDTVSEENTEYQYCITAQFDICTSDEKCETVKSGTTVGIAEEQTGLFRIYPNPAYDYITVTGTAMQHVAIYDITGRVVREINLNDASQSKISVSGLENGMYLLRIYSDGEVFTRRFAVIR